MISSPRSSLSAGKLCALRRSIAWLFIVLLLSPSFAQARPRLQSVYGKLPLSFEPNRGQADPRVRFLSRGEGYTLALTPTEALLALRSGAPERPPAGSPKRRANKLRHAPSQTLRMKLIGACPSSPASGQVPLAGKVNYLIGKDPRRWRRNVPTYGKARFDGVYPGIDLVYYGNGRQLEYDFLVAPGANPDKIRLRFEGQRSAKIDAGGNLILKMKGSELRLKRPVVYQEIGGKRQEVEGGYQKVGKDRIAFRIGKYDRTKPLVIDPVLVYSTYFGGNDQDDATDLAVDGNGSAFITGRTYSTDFTTKNPYQPNRGGPASGTDDADAYVLKLNPEGTDLEYATYLGGSLSDEGHGIAVDAQGNAYVCGNTRSKDFPVHKAFQGERGDRIGDSADAFVTVLDPTGSAPVYSTYLGKNGTELGRGIAVDANRVAYVTGMTTSYDYYQERELPYGWATSGGVFITALAPPTETGNATLAFSTYFNSPDGQNLGQGIAVDGSGNIHVVGTTNAPNFPTKKAFESAAAGSDETFVAMISLPAGTEKATLVYSSLLTGEGQDIGWDLAVDASGNAYVGGVTYSQTFTTKNALQSVYGGAGDAFVSKITPPSGPDNATLVYSTYLGGEQFDEGTSIAVDGNGNAYAVGSTSSTRFPSVNPLQESFKGGRDAFILRLSPQGFADFSTYLGGTEFDEAEAVALGPAGTVYVTGSADSVDFPRTGVPLNPMELNGQVFVSKIDLLLTPSIHVRKISPERGGNRGEVTAYIDGMGFAPTATVKLVREGQPDITGQLSRASADGLRVAAVFDLTDRAVGSWDVVVTNPDGSSATLFGGFTVEPFQAPQVWVDLIGPSLIRAGRPATYTLLYGNRGNVNAVGVPIWVGGIPKMPR